MLSVIPLQGEECGVPGYFLILELAGKAEMRVASSQRPEQIEFDPLKFARLRVPGHGCI